MQIRMQIDIQSLFTRAANTLETFSSLRANSLGWLIEPVALPHLRKLILGTCDIDSDILAAWLKQLPELECMSCDCYMPADMVPQDPVAVYWKNALTSMRDHETLRRGQLGFDVRAGEGSFRFLFNKDSKYQFPDDIEKQFQSESGLVDHQSKLAAEQWLEGYVCGLVEWCPMLVETVQHPTSYTNMPSGMEALWLAGVISDDEVELHDV